MSDICRNMASFTDNLRNLSINDSDGEENNEYVHKNMFNLFKTPGQNSRLSDPEKILDLVRATVQKSFNDEISHLILEYYKIFRKASDNIYMNTKFEVTADTIYKQISLCLDEAKRTIMISQDICEKQFVEKSTIHNSASTVVDHGRVIASFPDKSLMKQQKMTQEIFSHIYKQHEPPRVMCIPTPSIFVSPNITQSSSNFTFMWNPEFINQSTEYIYGARANRLIGYASARGRIYTRHPNMFRYHADIKDKQWLSENKHMSLMSGRAVLLLLVDFKMLIEKHDDYAGKIHVTEEEIKSFRVPNFMTVKIKEVITKQLSFNLPWNSFNHIHPF